ncbi:hypothetical protein NP493_1468g00049 [Ridgeia piscesae]|uniref:Uncharacterized protein n=1 Tax=Ridgeia piscesae TaxID=27915 RepID=A0AAD9NDL6_RIDPI|nr:hypothetical protein NP493_1468g00049 [Ridgeia piscesae]
MPFQHRNIQTRNVLLECMHVLWNRLIVLMLCRSSSAVPRSEDDVFQWSVMCPEVTQEPES